MSPSESDVNSDDNMDDSDSDWIPDSDSDWIPERNDPRSASPVFPLQVELINLSIKVL